MDFLIFDSFALSKESNFVKKCQTEPNLDKKQLSFLWIFTILYVL